MPSLHSSSFQKSKLSNLFLEWYLQSFIWFKFDKSTWSDVKPFKCPHFTTVVLSKLKFSLYNTSIFKTWNRFNFRFNINFSISLLKSCHIIYQTTRTVVWFMTIIRNLWNISNSHSPQIVICNSRDQTLHLHVLRG